MAFPKFCTVFALACACSRAPVATRRCELPWSLDGELVCQSDLYLLSDDLARSRVHRAKIRPGSTYTLRASQLHWTGDMDPRWLSLFGVPVWIHGDSRRRLRSLGGLGSRRIAALQDCPKLSCCDPGRVPGVGPKTLAKWKGRARIELERVPCLQWQAQGWSLAPCELRGDDRP